MPTTTPDTRTAPEKALGTAKWARTMTKWLITHSSKGGVKWQLVEFGGENGHESYGIVDMVAIRKNHTLPANGGKRGDIFEIVLIQVKGGSAAFPSEDDVNRLLAVKDHHRADRVVLAEWKKGKKLCLYDLADMKNAIDPAKVFGKIPTDKTIVEKAS